jgi:hypothetical protein
MTQDAKILINVNNMDIQEYTREFMTNMIENERKLAQGLLAARSMTTAQIAARIRASFGDSGAENIARAILNRYDV